MIQSLSDILVVSDMDGTLLADDRTLPLCNIETIRLFTSMGGHFAVATGRTVSSVSHYTEILPSLSPTITSGGCVIYDFKQSMVRKNALLSRVVARRAVQDILRAFPSFGAVVAGSDGRIYQVSASEYTHKLMVDEQHSFFVRPYDDVTAGWNKVLFAGPHEQMGAINEFTQRMNYPSVYFVETAPYYFEMMPQFVSKGHALRDLCNMLDISIENTFVIGDYYNDLDMMRAAGHAVAMANAPRDIQLAADEVTAGNNEGGVGQFLYKLIKLYGE